MFDEDVQKEEKKTCNSFG